MPQVGPDNEPLLERLIYGFFGTAIKGIQVDTDGNLVVALDTGQSITVTQSVAANLKALVDINAGQSIAATQATAANLKALVDINAGQSIEVTQATAANLKATVTIPTGQDILARRQGLYGGSWINAALPFGVSDTWTETWFNTALAAGANNVDGAVVAANTLRVVTQVAFVYIGTPPTRVDCVIRVNGGAPINFRQLAPATNALYDRQGWWVQEPGDFIRLAVVGATLNDDLFGYASGFIVNTT